MESETHRVFIGIRLKNEETIEEITLFQKEFDEMRAVKQVLSQNLHITMKFLGNVSKQQIEEIKEALAALEIIHVKTTLKGATAFPKISYPRTLILSITEGAEQLTALQEQLDISLNRLGFKKEKRKFHPHLTIGRVKQRKGKVPLEEITQVLTKYQEHLFGPFEVLEIALIESTLTPSGPIYEDIYVNQASKK